VSDNLKAGVTKACFYDPAINRTYADMAAHYDTSVVPARPYMPISTIACQPRGFDRHHRTDTALADPGKKPLEAGSRNTGTRTAEIIVDDFNISPAELAGTLNKRILASFAFKVVCNLICSRLPDINNGLTRQMIGPYLTHPSSPLRETGSAHPQPARLDRPRLRLEASL
jgi:hypothetical protein